VDSAGVRPLDLQVKGPALGVVRQVRYEAAEITLSDNAMLVFYTDGVTEARSPADQLFGEARLNASLSSAAGVSADLAVRSVVSAVEQFADGAPQEDDITMLAVRWRRN
jgi:sigma-B regulation protein RsbU (phosphoserine phosphatase)